MVIISCKNEQNTVEPPSTENDISWMKTTGIEGENFYMVSHPDGYLLASEFWWSAGGDLFRLIVGDSVWNYTGYDSIYAPLFITSNGTILSKTMISTDNGATWIDNGIGPFTSFYEYGGIVHGSGYGNMNTYNRFNLAFSTDGGINWIRNDFSKWDPNPIIWCVIVNDLNELFLFIHGQGLYRRIPGIGSDYIGGFGLSSQTAIKDENGYLYFNDYRIRRSTDNGYNWQIISDIVNYRGPGSWAINSMGHLFLGLPEIGIMRSVDHGDSWEIVNDNLPNLNIYNLCIDEDDFLYASTSYDGGIFRTKETTVRK